MIARRQQEHQHDVAQPAESDQRLNHEPVWSYTYYIYVLPTSHRSFSHLCPFGKWRQMPFPPHLYSEHSERQRARWISPPGPRFLLLASCFFALQAHFTTNSILRFLNFPSSVSFGAIGIVSPKPFATIMF